MVICADTRTTTNPSWSRSMNIERSLPAVHILLQALEEIGVTHIFGVPGGPLVPLFEALDARQRIQPILTKHEEGAAFAAEGYARVRRNLGVCCATSGPGATNALTGVTSANSDSVPLLLLSAQVASTIFGKGGVQDSSGGNRTIDLVDAYRTATKLSLMLQNAGQMPHMIRRVIRTALTGRPGAVHLNLPCDIIKQPIPVHEVPITKFYSHTAPIGDPQAVRKVADTLKYARMPVFLVGHGINLAGAWAPLQRVAEVLGIPVATTLKGKSAFPEHHPLSLGVFGFGGHPLADAYVLCEDVDVVVLLGTSLGEFQTSSWNERLVKNRTVVQIDADPSEIGKNFPVDLDIVGDAKAVLDALADALILAPRKAFPRALKQMRTEISRFYNAEELQGQAKFLKPHALVAKMNEILPDDTLLFVDNGNCLSWAGQFYEARKPGTVFFATNTASMGYAIAASIGGKIAAPDKPVVALLGDGAFAMNGLEIHTAADYNIPVIWVVLNNGGHGMVYNGETLITGKSYLSLYKKPLDISAIARAVSVQAFRVRTLTEFEESLHKALLLQQPCLIEAMVDLEEIPRSLQLRTNTLKTFFGKQNMTGQTS